MSELKVMKRKKVNRPPAPRGYGVRRVLAPGSTGLEMTTTELGDAVERALSVKLEWTPLVGAGAGKVRQGPFDMIDEDGSYVEVKAFSVHAGEFKAKYSAHSLQMKMIAAARMGVKTATVFVIVERSAKGKLIGWAYRREGIGNYRLGMEAAGWEFVGKVKVKI